MLDFFFFTVSLLDLHYITYNYIISYVVGCIYIQIVLANCGLYFSLICGYVSVSYHWMSYCKNMKNTKIKAASCPS